ncbi:MAG: MFS transporter TsgA [Pseudomonadota bacterium]
MNDRQRVTLACFLAYFVMSAMLAPIGIVSTPLAAHFNVTISEITNAFSALTQGILIGAVVALSYSARTPLRVVFVVLFVVMSGVLLLMSTLPNLGWFQAALLIIGVGCGLGLAAAAATISAAFEGNQRASALVATDGCFSVAGILIPAYATYSLRESLPVGSVYGVIAGIAALVVVLATVSRFPRPPASRTSQPSAGSRWPLSAWLGIAALTTYTLGQYAILWWLPPHLDARWGIEIASSGVLVGRFWTGMFIAQIVVTIAVLRIGTFRLLGIAAVLTAVGSIPLWTTGDMRLLPSLALLWGIANLGLLKLALTFVTLQFEAPSPRLVSCVLLGATLGTAISPFVSSRIVELAGTGAVLKFGTACHAVMALLIITALKIKKQSKT